MTKNPSKVSLRLYALMFFNFVIYSFCLVMASWAGQFPMLSFSALWRYFIGFCLLGIYAIIWQQILKHIPLNIAYSGRAVTVLLGMLWGLLFFSEVITWNMILGSAIIIIGIILMAVRRE